MRKCLDDRWDGGPCASLGGPISRDFQAAHALGGFAVGLHFLGKTWLRDCVKKMACNSTDSYSVRLHVHGVQPRRASRFQRSAPAPSSVDRAPLLLWHFTSDKIVLFNLLITPNNGQGYEVRRLSYLYIQNSPDAPTNEVKIKRKSRYYLACLLDCAPTSTLICLWNKHLRLWLARLVEGQFGEQRVVLSRKAAPIGYCLSVSRVSHSRAIKATYLCHCALFG